MINHTLLLYFLLGVVGFVLKIILLFSIFNDDESNEGKTHRKNISIAALVLVILGLVGSVTRQMATRANNNQQAGVLSGFLGAVETHIAQIVFLILLIVNAHDDDGSDQYKKTRKMYGGILIALMTAPFLLVLFDKALKR